MIAPGRPRCGRGAPFQTSSTKKSRISGTGKPVCTTVIERAVVVSLEGDLDARGHRHAVGAAARRLGDEAVRAVDLEERLRLAEERVADRAPRRRSACRRRAGRPRSRRCPAARRGSRTRSSASRRRCRRRTPLGRRGQHAGRSAGRGVSGVGHRRPCSFPEGEVGVEAVEATLPEPLVEADPRHGVVQSLVAEAALPGRGRPSRSSTSPASSSTWMCFAMPVTVISGGSASSADGRRDRRRARVEDVAAGLVGERGERPIEDVC